MTRRHWIGSSGNESERILRSIAVAKMHSSTRFSLHVACFSLVRANAHKIIDYSSLNTRLLKLLQGCVISYL